MWLCGDIFSDDIGVNGLGCARGRKGGSGRFSRLWLNGSQMPGLHDKEPEGVPKIPCESPLGAAAWIA